MKKFQPLILSLIFIGIIALLINSVKKTGYHLTISTTPSMPRGLYLVIPTKIIKRHDIVEFTPPTKALDFIKKKRWVPKSGLILKRVFAIPGDQVCTKNYVLKINGKKIAKIYKFYDQNSNKLLPQTKICGKLKESQYLLLSTKSKRSFDGRYFGPVSSTKILGRTVPILIFKK